MFEQDQEFALRSLDKNTLRGLPPPLTVHLNLPLAESTLEITATEMILFCHIKGKEGKL